MTLSDLERSLRLVFGVYNIDVRVLGSRLQYLILRLGLDISM